MVLTTFKNEKSPIQKLRGARVNLSAVDGLDRRRSKLHVYVDIYMGCTVLGRFKPVFQCGYCFCSPFLLHKSVLMVLFTNSSSFLILYGENAMTYNVLDMNDTRMYFFLFLHKKKQKTYVLDIH